MGQQDLTQDDIYNHFRDTATRFYDSSTNAWYDRIDVRAAIDAIVTDQHGDSFANATDLGRLSETLSVDGTIGKKSDVDAFSFVADADGKVTLEFSQTHELQSRFRLEGQTFEIDGNKITFDVTAGRQYRFSMETSGGIGHYQVDLSLEASSQNNIEATDWGVVADSSFNTGAIQGETWFRMTAHRDGIVSAIGNFASHENLRFEFHDAHMNLVASGGGQDGTLRLDSTFSSGQEFYLKVIGDSSQLDVRMVNLVNLESGNLSIAGTEHSDTISVSDSGNGGFHVTINDVAYQFQRSGVQSINLDAGSGSDHLHLNLGSTDDNVVVSPGSVTVTNQEYQLDAVSFSSIAVRNRGGGNDTVTMKDSTGTDWLSHNAFRTRLAGTGFSNQVIGFTDITVNASEGYDYASFQGSTRDEIFEADETSINFRSSVHSIHANHFDRSSVHGEGGNDQFIFTGSDDSDRFSVSQEFVRVYSGGHVSVASGFESVAIQGGAGEDQLILADSKGNDTVSVAAESIRLNGDYTFSGGGFENVSLKSQSGNDRVTISGTSGPDHVRMTTARTTLSSSQFHVSADGFSRVFVYADQGAGDTLEMIGSTGNDRLYWMMNQTAMFGSGYYNRAFGFENISVDTLSGFDSAYITGSSEAEELRITRDSARWDGESFAGQLRGVNRFHVTGQGRNDHVIMEGFGEDDWLQGNDQFVRARLNNTSVLVRNFERLDAHAYETASEDIDAVDYFFNLHGDWEEK